MQNRSKRTEYDPCSDSWIHLGRALETENGD